MKHNKKIETFRDFTYRKVVTGRDTPAPISKGFGVFRPV